MTSFWGRFRGPRISVSIASQRPPSKSPRFRIAAVEWLKAKLGGYFWLPCPNCGRNFGGQEEGESLMLTPSMGKMTCTNAKCMEQVRERNRKSKQYWGENNG